MYGKISKTMSQEPSVNYPVFDSDTSPQARLENGCYSLAYGFKVCWELNLSVPMASIELKWNDTSLGKWILDTTHTCTHIGINVGVASASLDLCADWTQNQITLKGEACFMGQCKEFDVVLFKW